MTDPFRSGKGQRFLDCLKETAKDAGYTFNPLPVDRILARAIEKYVAARLKEATTARRKPPKRKPSTQVNFPDPPLDATES